MKQKILFVSNTFSRAGAEMALLELLYAIDETQYDVSIFILSNQGELARELPAYVRLLNTEYDNYSCLDAAGYKRFQRALMGRCFRKGVFFRDLPYFVYSAVRLALDGRFDLAKIARRFLADAADVPPAIRKETFDLAVSFVEGGAPIYTDRRVHAKKKATFVHIDYREAGYAPYLDGRAYRNADRIFAVSQEVKDAFCAVYPKEAQRVFVFPNRVSPERIRAKAQNGDPGFADAFDGMRLLTIARLYPQKALDVSIRACRLLKERGLAVRWYVLGEGILKEELQALIRELSLEDTFFLLGMRENPYVYLKEADIYVHATAFEGKSIAIREAQIMGKPIILTDCSGNREQAADGVDGLFCRLDAKDIADKITLLCQDGALRERIAQAAAAKEQNTDDLHLLYELLCK